MTVGTGGRLIKLSLTYGLRCTARPRLRRGTATVVTPKRPVGMSYSGDEWRFTFARDGTNGVSYSVEARFPSTTRVLGSFTAEREDCRGNVLCGTGVVNWSAST